MSNVLEVMQVFLLLELTVVTKHVHAWQPLKCFHQMS